MAEVWKLTVVHNATLSTNWTRGAVWLGIFARATVASRVWEKTIWAAGEHGFTRISQAGRNLSVFLGFHRRPILFCPARGEAVSHAHSRSRLGLEHSGILVAQAGLAEKTVF
jgi:hypothetical protein